MYLGTVWGGRKHTKLMLKAENVESFVQNINHYIYLLHLVSPDPLRCWAICPSVPQTFREAHVLDWNFPSRFCCSFLKELLICHFKSFISGALMSQVRYFNTLSHVIRWYSLSCLCTKSDRFPALWLQNIKTFKTAEIKLNEQLMDQSSSAPHMRPSQRPGRSMCNNKGASSGGGGRGTLPTSSITKDW